jgi:hypothetical protein
MTEPTRDPAADPTQSPAGPGDSPPPPTFEQRMEDFGRRAEAAGERFGRDAQAAGERWSKDPRVVGATDTAARLWGVLVLAVGLWFFADITLRMDMPRVAWADVWPLALILVGLVVVARGWARNRA